jgi:DNA processing protein
VSDLAVSTYAAVTGAHVLEPPVSGRFNTFLRTFDERGVRARLRECGIRYVGRSEEEFPFLLRAIHDPPPGVYLRGEGAIETLSRPAVAIVGARASSPYGRTVARMLARTAAAAGLVVVSGLARGIDGEAHRGALDASGTTIAVLGCGIDRDYPAAHADLARRIAREGLLVSEYAPGVEPAPWRFPARNRIIAGLCAATVAVEARERSGALITIDFALEEGREVLAVPGEITSSLSRGTNALLRLGATPLLDPSDLLSVYGLESAEGRSLVPEGPAATVMNVLSEQAADVDELVRRTGQNPGDLAAALTELELAGLVLSDAGTFRATIPRP